MDFQTKFIILALGVLVPIGTILFQWVFFRIGRFIWESFLMKKLKRTSKLRIKFIEIKHRDGPEIIYVLTGIVVIYLFFGLISLFV